MNTKAVMNTTAVAIVGVVLACAVGCTAPAAPPRSAPPTSVPAASITAPSTIVASPPPAPVSSAPSVPAGSPPPPPDTAQHIAQLVTEVPVVALMPNVPGYERSCKAGKGCVFGPAWADTERTGCDTRNRVLGAQLANVTFKPGTRDCKVTGGILNDPYTGATLVFGGGSRDSIEIDHVYPLARAWDAGAAQWSLERRMQFSNDTENLLAVSGPENRRKSDLGPSGWLPPNRSFACRYLEIYLSVAAKYQLLISDGDKSVAVSTCLP